LRADVVFCPFTASQVRDPGVPLVAAIDDLQHVSHPHLLTSSQRAARARAFETIAYRAARVVCAASSLREVALRSGVVRPDNVAVLPPGRLLVQPPPVQREFAHHGLRENGFFLLAADVEPRSNHRLVLAALGMLRARQPDVAIHVVCVGGPEARMASLRTLAEGMGLGAKVHFPGAMRRDDLTTLVNACRGVLVPSLYDTMGEMLLQAMALGKPVLCSSIAGLAELTDGAALTFDPHRPDDLAAALERTAHEPWLLDHLARVGRQRFATLEDPASIARAYVGVFGEARMACPASR
jgi:glycosyltransferase involved in cell wall biosynthesis